MGVILIFPHTSQMAPSLEGPAVCGGFSCQRNIFKLNINYHHISGKCPILIEPFVSVNKVTALSYHNSKQTRKLIKEDIMWIILAKIRVNRKMWTDNPLTSIFRLLQPNFHDFVQFFICTTMVCYDILLHTQTQLFIQMDNPGIEHSSALTLRAQQ